jgi:hypothetical protein
MDWCPLRQTGSEGLLWTGLGLDDCV